MTEGKITIIQEFNLIKTLLEDIKQVLTFNPDTLKEQHYLWLSIPPQYTITDEKQRLKILESIEKHCHTPCKWCLTNEIEVNINPQDRLPSHYLQKQQQ